MREHRRAGDVAATTAAYRPPAAGAAVLLRGLVSAACLGGIAAAAGKEDLAPTPPMGYNTWNDLECKPSDKKLRSIVTKLKSLKFLELGYQYIVIDDCWMAEARLEGKLTGNKELFPSGIASISQFVRKNGFKFGIYTDRAANTCMGLPGSMGHEEVDAKTFAEWGVDYVKNDGCWDPDCGVFQPSWPKSGMCRPDGRRKAVEKYAKMFRALGKTGRPIVHSISGWQPWYAPVGRRIGHLWRVAADVRNWGGVYETARVMEHLGQWHGPNGWNDPDMLMGSSNKAKIFLTPLQARAQFSLWALMSAPLMLGVSVIDMSSYDFVTYSNKDVIKIDQDPKGRPAKVVMSTCPPYPQINVSVSADDIPLFSVITPEIPEEVICGSHTAPSCELCTQGHGEGWCNADCRWIKSTKKCIPAEEPGHIDEDKKRPQEEMPDPWTLKAYREPRMRECFQVWTKELVSGEVAVVVINWGSTSMSMSIKLDMLGLPWLPEPRLGASVFVKDLWYTGSVTNPWVVTASLDVSLKGLGGFVMMKLREAPDAGTGQATPQKIETDELFFAASGKAPEVEKISSAWKSTVPQERLRAIERRQRMRLRLAEVAAADAGWDDGESGGDSGSSGGNEGLGQDTGVGELDVVMWVAVAAVVLAVLLLAMLGCRFKSDLGPIGAAAVGASARGGWWTAAAEAPGTPSKGSSLADPESLGAASSASLSKRAKGK